MECGDAGPRIGGVVSAAAFLAAGGFPAEGVDDLAELLFGHFGFEDAGGFGEGDVRFPAEDVHASIVPRVRIQFPAPASRRDLNP